MIGVSSSGSRFAPLAKYLSVGRSGQEHDRVAWSQGRHLPTDDPRLAGHIMQATARHNPQVKEPVYHLSISFDPGDSAKATPELMRGVADRLLRDMKLDEHQAMIVAHRDRDHAHMHIMVNRVHPDTFHAWDRWRDYAVMQQSLREQERALGLTEVRGRLYLLPGQEMPAAGHLTRGEVRQQARGEQPFIEKAQARLNDLREAKSWPDLHERLTAHGMRAERKGQGLVVRDDTHEVKASRVGRDVSLKHLEARLGPYVAAERVIETQAHSRDVVAELHGRGRGIERAIDRIQRVERSTVLQSEAYNAGQKVAEHLAKLERLEWWVGRTQSLSDAFNRALTAVYHDPAKARQQFEALVRQEGWAASVRAVTAQPERLGPLTEALEESRWGFNRWTVTVARAQVPNMERAATSLGESTDRLAGQVQRITGVSSADATALARAFGQVHEDVNGAKAVAAKVREDLGRMPDGSTLSRQLERALGSLAPVEVRQLMTMLTEPQRYIARQAIQRVHEMLVGREGPAYG